MRRVLACAETLDAWAASTKYGERKVSFLCVGCDGPETASRFVAELGLDHCMLGFIKSPSDLPLWGQLGYSGFIIVDAQKRIVTKATAAYLQVKELASGHVEVLLDALLAGAAAPSVYPGQAVALDIVNEPKKHGNKGVVLDTVDQVDGECSQLLHVQQAHNISAAAGRRGKKEGQECPFFAPARGVRFFRPAAKPGESRCLGSWSSEHGAAVKWPSLMQIRTRLNSFSTSSRVTRPRRDILSRKQ